MIDGPASFKRGEASGEVQVSRLREVYLLVLVLPNLIT